MTKYKFITFEGGEGSGKTTQSKLLFNYLYNKGINSIHTREPGGTDFALKIRELLLTSTGDNISPMTELLLHNAARSEHVEKVIKPALKEEKVIICDRYIDSTTAYQAYGHKININHIYDIHKIVTQNLMPDITFFLDIEPQEGLSRANKRLGDSSSNENRYENMDIYFHERVYQGFKEIAKNEPTRFISINAKDSIDNIHTNILQYFI